MHFRVDRSWPGLIEATLFIEMWLAARVMPLQVSLYSFPRILAIADSAKAERYAGIAPERIASIVKRITRHPWTMRKRRCLREGLLGFRYMCKAGHSPELHFSVPENIDNFDRSEAHCWVEVDGKPVLNENLAKMVPIHVYRASRTHCGQ